MLFLKLTIILACILVVFAEKNETKNRNKRQHLSFHSRRIGRPPPYAVQMEPIAHYSQRDPLYNPLAESKSDDQSEYYEESPYNYYPTEPEPIIEIIIKESNESLPTPIAPPAPPTQKPKKEPIQVFYVKYEKKQEYGEDKPRVVYDTPIPAITPVEEHEEIKPDESENEGYPLENGQPVTPSSPEPSTTLRAVIRPDSEIYHSGNSGIRVTFGTEQIPPNNHNKRSDKDSPSEVISNKPTALPPPGSSKRPHGPFAPIQPISPRIPPAFPQQRIINSFSQQQLLGSSTSLQSGPPPNFSLQPQFHQPIPPHIRNQYQQIHSNQRPQQRPPLTIQGLPEIQQRLPFNSYVSSHHLNVNNPQQSGPPQPSSISHQNTQLSNFQQQLPANSPPSNFNFDLQLRYKQQREQDKQRYIEQQRLLEQRQEQKRHQEQQRFQDLQRQQDQQRQQEQHRQYEQQEQQRQQEYRISEQRRKHEQEQQKLHMQQQQEQQQYKFEQTQQPQQSQSELPQKQLGGEILKAIPKLEQHYAIRENPLHPGPFPPNPQYAEVPRTPYGTLTNTNQLTGSLQQFNLVQQSQQQLPAQQNIKHNSNAFKQQSEQQQKQHQEQQQQQLIYQNQQSFLSQNLPRSQQQISQESLPQSSILGRPIFQSKILNSNQKIYATPTTKTIDNSNKYTISTPNNIRYSPTTPRTTTIKVLSTQSTTTPLTTTLSPKNEAKIKENIANLPDEVPDDIREQLLSSGILGNADIQILDYDKVGGINIGDLPPEALANFYGAGGAAATAASEPVPQIAKRPKIDNEHQDESEIQVAASSSNIDKSLALRVESQVQTEEITLRPGGVEMKVVRFDPNTAQGQTIADRHISYNATRLNPVAVGERESDNSNSQYNRYLPLKVSGASFPIPSAPELSGKRITSVVVLAPVDYNFQAETEQSARQNRKIANDVQAIRFLAGESLKQLVKKPSAENYKRWLDQERQTEPQRQSVVLLVTTPNNNSEIEKEIFMYDVSSETVSKLAGDLSTAFVDAAESNSDVNQNPMVDALSTIT